MYPFASDELARWSAANPQVDSITAFPLLFDPGTGWAYAGGIAVVGRVLEQIEGTTLAVFLEERLFDPLGMNDTGYAVPDAKRSRVAAVFRMTDEGLVESPGIAPDGTPLLEAESVRVLTQNRLGDVRVSLQEEPLPFLARAFPLGAGRDGFGLGFQVTGAHIDAYQRAPGSLSWAGIFNTEFWIDPASGIGAVLLMQYLPFYDEAAIATLRGFEELVYRGLR